MSDEQKSKRIESDNEIENQIPCTSSSDDFNDQMGTSSRPVNLPIEKLKKGSDKNCSRKKLTQICPEAPRLGSLSPGDSFLQIEKDVLKHCRLLKNENVDLDNTEEFVHYIIKRNQHVNGQTICNEDESSANDTTTSNISPSTLEDKNTLNRSPSPLLTYFKNISPIPISTPPCVSKKPHWPLVKNAPMHSTPILHIGEGPVNNEGIDLELPKDAYCSPKQTIVVGDNEKKIPQNGLQSTYVTDDRPKDLLEPSNCSYMCNTI